MSHIWARVRGFVLAAGICCAFTVQTESFASSAPPNVDAIIAMLPSNEQQNVIVVNRNGAILPHAAANPQVAMASAVDVQSNAYADSSGSTYVATYVQDRPPEAPAGTNATPPPDSFFHYAGEQVYAQWQVPFDIRTGALHGVRAKNGYVAQRMSVSIPCHAAKMLTKQGTNPITQMPGPVDAETGYIYIGGWGAGRTGVALDAGLQKSSAQNLQDDYATYWKFGRNDPVTFSRRFPCDDNRFITMELRPLSSTALAYTTSGAGTDGRALSQTVIQITQAADGWRFDGGTGSDGVILKRMVTIAQPPSWHQAGSAELKPTWKHDAWFGVRETDSRPLITWRTCELATALKDGRPDYQRWGPAQTYINKSMVQDIPRGAVLARSVPSLCDVDAIDLRKSAI